MDDKFERSKQRPDRNGDIAMATLSHKANGKTEPTNFQLTAVPNRCILPNDGLPPNNHPLSRLFLFLNNRARPTRKHTLSYCSGIPADYIQKEANERS